MTRPDSATATQRHQSEFGVGKPEAARLNGNRIVSGQKACTGCRKLLPLSEFFKDRQKITGLTSLCKPCFTAQAKKWRESEAGIASHQKRVDSGYFKRQGKLYYHSEHGNSVRKKGRQSERAKEYRRSERRKELERISYRNPDRQAAIKVYRSSPEYRATISRDRAKRRAAERGITATLTALEWGDVLNLYNHKCAYCGADGKLTVDHDLPISRGGQHTKENVVPACARCNSRKHDKTGSEFRVVLGGVS